MLTDNAKGLITAFSMGISCLAGFYYQQYLIEKYYVGAEAEIHQRVKELKRLELAAIQQQGEGTSGSGSGGPDGRSIR